MNSHSSVLAIAMLLASATFGAAQQVHKVSGKNDDKNFPAAAVLPGFTGSEFKQQILIDPARLTPLLNRPVRSMSFRRDLSRSRSMQGGQIDVTIRFSTSTRSPGRASSVFARNAPSSTQTTVFNGLATIPNSPAASANLKAWHPRNSVRFALTPFVYRGGTLCVEIVSRIRAGKTPPAFWYAEHEYAPAAGRAVAFGSSCSQFKTVAGLSLSNWSTGVQLGNTLVLTLHGRLGSQPLLLLGGRLPQPLDLSIIGAGGCHQYVDNAASIGLVYHTLAPLGKGARAMFEVQAPASSSLVGAKVALQSVDLETPVRRALWTNNAGLVTSNGLELQFSSAMPAPKIVVVRSRTVARGKPMPNTGRVDGQMGPVIRFDY